MEKEPDELLILKTLKNHTPLTKAEFLDFFVTGTNSGVGDNKTFGYFYRVLRMKVFQKLMYDGSRITVNGSEEEWSWDQFLEFVPDSPRVDLLTYRECLRYRHLGLPARLQEQFVRLVLAEYLHSLSYVGGESSHIPASNYSVLSVSCQIAKISFPLYSITDYEDYLLEIGRAIGKLEKFLRISSDDLPSRKPYVQAIQNAARSADTITTLVDLLPPYVRYLRHNGYKTELQDLQNLPTEPDVAPGVTRWLRSLGFEDDFLQTTLVYPSGRPRTEMKFLPREPQLLVDEEEGYLVIRGSDGVVVEDIYVGNIQSLEGRVIIPIIRYQAGMSRGLYYSGKTETEWCGTFYYFEPDSDYLLQCSHLLITPNKFLAYLRLAEQHPDEETDEIVAQIHNGFPNLIERMTSGQYDFLKHNRTLYAEEDFLDQPLCRLAKRAGYQVVLLTTMTGRYRIVTEVLDTRSREESFAAIVRRR